MKRILPFASIVVGIIAVWVVVAGMVKNEDVQNPTITPDIATERYSSDKLGIAFDFSAHYDLVERDLSSGYRNRYSLTLIEDGYVPPIDGEGPTMISVDIFQNDLDHRTAEGFATGASESNWKIGPGTLTPRTVGGEEGVEYTWSGLYEGRSLVVARPDFIYMFTATSIAPEDRILTDFADLLETVEFSEPSK